MTTSLVILTKNEIEGLTAIFPKIDRSLFLEILPMDGGSTDGTIEYYESHGIRVPRREKVAYGDAFREAAKVAKGDIVIFFRPDGNEDPADLPILIRKIEEGADQVIASRFMKGSRNEEDDSLIRLRAWVNNAFTILANIFFNRSTPFITDTINGYRAIRREALQAMHLDAPRFSIEFQMTIRSWKLGHRMSEIPTIEGNRIGGVVKAKSMQVGLEMLERLLTELVNGKDFSKQVS